MHYSDSTHSNVLRMIKYLYKWSGIPTEQVNEFFLTLNSMKSIRGEIVKQSGVLTADELDTAYWFVLGQYEAKGCSSYVHQRRWTVMLGGVLLSRPLELCRILLKDIRFKFDGKEVPAEMWLTFRRNKVCIIHNKQGYVVYGVSIKQHFVRGQNLRFCLVYWVWTLVKALHRAGAKDGYLIRTQKAFDNPVPMVTDDFVLRAKTSGMELEDLKRTVLNSVMHGSFSSKSINEDLDSTCILMSEEFRKTVRPYVFRRTGATVESVCNPLYFLANAKWTKDSKAAKRYLDQSYIVSEEEQTKWRSKFNYTKRYNGQLRDTSQYFLSSKADRVLKDSANQKIRGMKAKFIANQEL